MAPFKLKIYLDDWWGQQTLWKNKVYIMNDKVDFHFVNVCVYIYIYIYIFFFGVIYNESFRKRKISMLHSIFIDTRSEILNPTRHMGWGCIWNFCRIFWFVIFDRSSLTVLYNKFLQNTLFKFTLKQTLSKSKPRLICFYHGFPTYTKWNSNTFSS